MMHGNNKLEKKSREQQPLPRAANDQIDRCILACQSAATQEELKHELQVIIKSSWREELSLSVREDFAVALVQTIVCNEVNQLFLEECLLSCCGKGVAISACVETLQAATENDPILKSQFCALKTALRTVKKVMCSIPSSYEDVEIWMKECFLADGRQQLMDHHAVITSTISGFVDLTMRLPSKIASACHATRVELPQWALPTRFYSRVLECSFQMVAFMFDGDEIAIAKLTRSYFTCLVAQLVHHRRASDDVAVTLYQCYVDRSVVSGDSFWSDEHFSDLIRDTIRQVPTSREKAVLLRSILCHSVGTKVSSDRENFTRTLLQMDCICQDELWGYLRITCLPSLMESMQVREAWVQLAIFSHSSTINDDWMDQLFCHCVALLLLSCTRSIEGEISDSDDDDDDESIIIRKHLNSVAESWAQDEFLRQNAHNVQQHVTNFLLSAMWLLSDKENPGSNLAESICQGVTIRLESSAPAIRKNGMLVAELFASRVGEELRFDEVADDDRKLIKSQQQKDNCEIHSPDAVKSVAIVQGGNQKPTRGRLHERQFLDPDAEYESDDENEPLAQDDTSTSRSCEVEDDEDSVWDDGDELVPYDLEDDEEDLRVAPRPCYLAECFEMLRTPETDETAYGRHLTALQELPALVRSRPIDLADHVCPLIIQLLRAENKFNIDGFSEKILRNLCSLAVEEPFLAGQCLIKELFEEGSHTDRMNVLSTLQEAAFELSGYKDLKEKRLQSLNLKAENQGLERKQLLSTSRSTQSDHDEKPRTQRWVRASSPRAIATINMFGQVAPAWFYTLVTGFLQRKDEYALWGGSLGARLLASFFCTLATILECSGNSPGASILAKDLIELVWTFRAAEIAEVRVVVLACVAASVSVLPEDEVANVIVSTSGLLNFLEFTIQEDPSQESKEMAAAIIKTVGSAFDSMQSPNRLL